MKESHDIKSLKSTVSNLIKMCEDYQFEIARLKKELREKKSDEDFVPLIGIIKSEDDEYLFVQYDILGIIKNLSFIDY